MSRRNETLLEGITIFVTLITTTGMYMAILTFGAALSRDPAWTSPVAGSGVTVGLAYLCCGAFILCKWHPYKILKLSRDLLETFFGSQWEQLAEQSEQSLCSNIPPQTSLFEQFETDHRKLAAQAGMHPAGSTKDLSPPDQSQERDLLKQFDKQRKEAEYERRVALETASMQAITRSIRQRRAHRIASAPLKSLDSLEL